jgi:hypothetical protein
MSTRCQIAIYENDPGDKAEGWNALIYRHSDGYPEDECGVMAALIPFVEGFVEQRGWDAEYLAARLVQHLCNEHDKGDDEPGVTGYGICCAIHGDIEYFYRVFPKRVECWNVSYGWAEDGSELKKARLVQSVAIPSDKDEE